MAKTAMALSCLHTDLPNHQCLRYRPFWIDISTWPVAWQKLRQAIRDDYRTRGVLLHSIVYFV